MTVKDLIVQDNPFIIRQILSCPGNYKDASILCAKIFEFKTREKNGVP